MFAVLSDIHANLEALTAVLADADRHGVERVVCLGDIVGYGPDPVACIDLVRQRCEVVLLGNFDQALKSEIDGYSPLAARSIYWTRSQLDSAQESREAREWRWLFLAYRPRFHRENGILYVHGSARNPLHEYVFPEDIYNQRKMERIFALIPHVCFCGHTHVQGMFVDWTGGYDSKTQTICPTGGQEEYTHYAPEVIDWEWQIGGNKTIINVGSVGQPRDSDPRAGYVLVEGGHVRFRRVDYDIETTIRKIYDVPDLGDFFGDRLRDGR